MTPYRGACRAEARRGRAKAGGCEIKMSQQAVSRILFASARLTASFGATTIPLAPPSLAGSSDRPGDSDGPSGHRRRVAAPGSGRLPIWSCSVRGFACHPCCHGRGALLPHLFTLTHLRSPEPFGLLASYGGRYVFCATFLQVALTGCYPAHCPAEFGLSSRLRPFGLQRTVVWLAANTGLYIEGGKGWTGRAGGAGSAGGAGRAGEAGGAGSAERGRERQSLSPSPLLPLPRVLPASTRRSPAKSDTARASCTSCCAACR